MSEAIESRAFFLIPAGMAPGNPSGAALVVYHGNICGPGYGRHATEGQSHGESRKLKIRAGGLE
jgi:hypothetical protein